MGWQKLQRNSFKLSVTGRYVTASPRTRGSDEGTTRGVAASSTGSQAVALITSYGSPGLAAPDAAREALPEAASPTEAQAHRCWLPRLQACARWGRDLVGLWGVRAQPGELSRQHATTQHVMMWCYSWWN